MGSAVASLPPGAIAEPKSVGVSLRTWSVGLIVAAVLMRTTVFVIASSVFHISLAGYAAKGDGASYLAYANAILGDRSQLTEYDRRVFPGYPVLIAAVRLCGTPLPLAALVIDWLSAGVAAAAAVALFRDARVGLAMLLLVPHYLTNSSLAMSEAPMLAFALTGLLLVIRRQHLVGGALLGFACLVRPMACFAAAGMVVMLATQRGPWRRQLLLVSTGGFLVFAAGVLVVHWLTADVLQSLRVYRNSPRAYGGHLFEWPFYSLINTPRSEHASPGFVAYVYAHVVIVLFACAGLVARVARQLRTARELFPGNTGEAPVPRRAMDVLACTWLLGNTFFQLCIGSTWGFRHFPRFAIPAQPALFWALCPMLPRTAWPWWTAAGGIGYMAVVCVNLTP